MNNYLKKSIISALALGAVLAASPDVAHASIGSVNVYGWYNPYDVVNDDYYWGNAEWMDYYSAWDVGSDGGGDSSGGYEEPEPEPLANPERIPVVLQCAAEQHTRDTQAWVAYRAYAQAAHGTFGSFSWDADNIGDQFSFLFADGSVGVYQRTDGEFRASDGMVEIKAPSCGG